MSLLNDTTKQGEYKHLNYTERTQIERWFNIDKKKPKEISKLLNKSVKTIRRERKRGLVENLNSDLTVKLVYSADIAQEKYDYNMSTKGPDLKIGNNLDLIKKIEYKIKVEKKSPEVAVFETGADITAMTVRNYIELEIIFDITPGKIIYKKERKSKNSTKRTCNKVPAEKSIDFRPKAANNRTEYGHWEGDLVIGRRKKGAVLLTLTERVTREEIIIKLPNKMSESVAKAFDQLEKKFKKRFGSKFKTITFDNGVEFRNYKLIEQSMYKDEKRFEMYYAHPYCSGERGSNENNNRLIRRWIPKGTLIDNISIKYIAKIESWINNYPRKMFDYKSSDQMLVLL